MDGFVVRVGEHWGRASVEWARRRLGYAGPMLPLIRRPRLEVWLQGEPATHSTPEGVTLIGLGFEPVPGLSIADVHAGCTFRGEAADIWSRSAFLAVDAARSRIEILTGQYYPLGLYYARRGGDLFVAPEIKAFSNVPSLRAVQRLLAGHYLLATADGGEARITPVEDGAAYGQTNLAYEQAVARCREIMEESVDRTLAGLAEPLALSLSGGLDSSILCYMLARRRAPFRAFNAWFDAGRGEAPADVSNARRVARDLGIPLEEVRVDRSLLIELYRDAIYFGERKTARITDNALYHLPLLEAMRSAGFRWRICGDGIDSYFGGYENYRKFMEPGAFRNLYSTILRSGNTRHTPAFHARCGMSLLKPFASRAMLDFALTLPPEYLMRLEGERFYGKRIVRDAFRGEVPDFILNREKAFPGEANDASVLTEQVFGGPLERGRAFRKLRQELLAPPELGSTPAWVVRSGWLEWPRRGRLKVPA